MKNYMEMAQKLSSMGNGNDSILAHINPREAMILKLMGGSGTVNNKTGLPQFDDSGSGGMEVGGDPSGGDLASAIAAFQSGDYVSGMQSMADAAEMGGGYPSGLAGSIAALQQGDYPAAHQAMNTAAGYDNNEGTVYMNNLFELDPDESKVSHGLKQGASYLFNTAGKMAGGKIGGLASGGIIGALSISNPILAAALALGGTLVGSKLGGDIAGSINAHSSLDSSDYSGSDLASSFEGSYNDPNAMSFAENITNDDSNATSSSTNDLLGLGRGFISNQSRSALEGLNSGSAYRGIGGSSGSVNVGSMGIANRRRELMTRLAENVSKNPNWNYSDLMNYLGNIR